ncbi:Galactose oxidase/kelch, beta-propeller [Trema orientale]|uniref:Galactose oxidase/kelch, beta-propeller n=1 Tax=Trema orientale TaxID=63057 RepID=A0A2P5CB78_TREOI|nr:Galactose oxidase/kelch, beta-propeller [Trema orientale]
MAILNKRIHIYKVALQPSAIFSAILPSPNLEDRDEIIFSVHCSENSEKTRTYYKCPQRMNSLHRSIVGGDNGILCFVESLYDTVDLWNPQFLGDIVYLWNPTTNEVKKIPSSPTCSPPYALGFGLHHSNNDFKVVKFSVSSDDHLFKIRNEVLVYSLETDSWKTIQMPYNILSSSDLDPNFSYSSVVSDFVHSKTSFVVNGSVHWMLRFGRPPLGYDLGNQGTRCGIVAFDLSKELFSLIDSPQDIHGSFVDNIEISYLGFLDEIFED